MAIIRSSADLRNKYKEISELCKTTGQPVYITVNGREDTAIVDSKIIDELYQTIKLMQEINQGIVDVNTDRVMSLKDAKKRLSWHIKSLSLIVLFAGNYHINEIYASNELDEKSTFLKNMV